MKLKMRESDMKYKTYGNAERCFDILVKEKGYSRDEAQEILNNLMADYHYNPNSNQTLLRRVNQVLSKDEYEAEMEFARQNNPFKKEAYAYNLDNKESRRKEIADRFGKPFTPDDHMLVCKDGKLMNVQVGKKYKCTAFNGQRAEIVSIDDIFPDDKGDLATITALYRGRMYTIGSNQLYESFGRLHEQDVEIEVKHEGILEVPEGKNVDDLPISHFEKLAKKKGLSKITRALNNLQVWNKNDDPKLSKWAGDMIDKLNKRMGKEESYMRYNKRRSIRESKEDKYFVGCFRKASNRYDTNTYDEIFTTNSRSEAWEFALRYNMRGYYVEFNESDGNGDYNSIIYKPREMVKDSNLINIKKESRSRFNESYGDDMCFWVYHEKDINNSRFNRIENSDYDRYTISDVKTIKLYPNDEYPMNLSGDLVPIKDVSIFGDYDAVLCTEDDAYEHLKNDLNNKLDEKRDMIEHPEFYKKPRKTRKNTNRRMR